MQRGFVCCNGLLGDAEFDPAPCGLSWLIGFPISRCSNAEHNYENPEHLY
jgi:hypothetical protein